MQHKIWGFYFFTADLCTGVSLTHQFPHLTNWYMYTRWPLLHTISDSRNLRRRNFRRLAPRERTSVRETEKNANPYMSYRSFKRGFLQGVSSSTWPRGNDLRAPGRRRDRTTTILPRVNISRASRNDSLRSRKSDKIELHVASRNSKEESRSIHVLRASLCAPGSHYLLDTNRKIFISHAGEQITSRERGDTFATCDRSAIVIDEHYISLLLTSIESVIVAKCAVDRRRD